MFYSFRCPKCNSRVEREIKMEDYDKVKNSQLCNNCGSTLERIIEFDGLLKAPGYGVDGNISWHTK